jgi:hypothetical protein
MVHVPRGLREVPHALEVVRNAAAGFTATWKVTKWFVLFVRVIACGVLVFGSPTSPKITELGVSVS